LALLDPEASREFRLIAAHHVDEALGVLASDERLDGVAEREVGRDSVVTTA